eukprot:1193792-Prorocentrum_minimum.AAC.3
MFITASDVLTTRRKPTTSSRARSASSHTITPGAWVAPRCKVPKLLSRWKATVPPATSAAVVAAKNRRKSLRPTSVTHGSHGRPA